MLDTLGCVLDVGWGGEGGVFSCLSCCHALFLLGFHWFSVTFAPWVRWVYRVADGSVVWFWVFGWGSLRSSVGFCLVVLGHGLSHGVFGVGIRRVRVVFGGFLGQIPIFCGVCAKWDFVLVGILG